jgi:glycosyltransferase involved in cell wall biosynthesis
MTAKDVTQIYSLTKPFILAVGTIQPRKNFERLIEAFALLHQQKEFAGYELLIVGKKGWLFEDILAAPQKNQVTDAVRFLEFVPDEDLASLYEKAACFVLPSLYEGFGLPVLEAMAHGCPVVVSNVSSLPEIAGEAGVYVDPEKKESIMEGLATALREKGTEKELRRQDIGKKRLELFQWNKAAVQTLDILEKVGRGEL